MLLSIKSYVHVRTATIAKEAWRNLQTIYEDKDLNRLSLLIHVQFEVRRSHVHGTIYY